MNEPAIDRHFEWDESQQEAISRCCDMQQRIVPITGVAGTGKTTIIREVYTVLCDAGYSVVLCAPTGKAAKRIQEATGIPAQTIHRLLEYPHPGERDEQGKALVHTDPKRGRNVSVWNKKLEKYEKRDNLLTYQVVLADEYAMVNREVHRNLIDALPAGGRLCMFGDVNQLKPIEQGKLAVQESPFQAGLRRFNGTVLNTIWRTQEGSGVAFNGDRILRGMIPLRKDDFALRITEQPVTTLCDTVMDMLEHGVNMGTNAGQIISVTKKSWIGTYKLNVALQGLLNPLPPSARLKLPRHTWDSKLPLSVGIGDKVIWTENAYDLRDPWDRYESSGYDENGTEVYRSYIPTPPDKIIMNGESGIVTAISDDGDVQIDLGDRLVNIPHTLTVEAKRGGLIQIDPRKTIDLGFCITTHKAQGSEWPHVIYMLNASTAFMQSRHNFYTAISRASQTATVITDQRSLQNSVFQKMSAIERAQAR